MIQKIWPPKNLNLLFHQLFSFIILSFLFLAPDSRGDLLVHIGPAASGGGGPNPVSIPPTELLDYEVVWITAANREYSASFVPGLFYGQRYSFLPGGTYFSVGGGLVLDLNGYGPGVYSAFGYDACAGFICFNAEYKQALGLGISFETLLAPYAIRIGLMVKI